MSEYEQKRQFTKSYKTKAYQKRTFPERAADLLTPIFGSFSFLVFNFVTFVVWIALNIEVIPGIEPFDPFPFSLLTTIVSLEAIILSIAVLISQNRETKVSDLRSELDTRIDIITEEEVTKLLELVTLLLKDRKIDVSKDKKLAKMLKPVDKSYLERKFEAEVQKSTPKPAWEGLVPGKKE